MAEGTLTLQLEDLGSIRIQLLPSAAPRHCEAVTALANGGVYDGCCIYRAEPNFVIQGGLRTPDGQVKESSLVKKLPLEYKLKNTRGTVTMARWDDPNSATLSRAFDFQLALSLMGHAACSSEFFINLNDNSNLDRYGDSGWALGFTVWGQVADEESMAVAEAISALPTTSSGGMKMLTKPVKIVSARVH